MPGTDAPTDLDHVALAQHDVTATLSALVGDLGAAVLGGGNNVGFRVVQVRVGTPPSETSPGDGMTIELIEPWETERFDFLVRFLDRNGEGPHHLTFKVDDIRARIERLTEAGYEPVSANLDNPWWREAFLHPKHTFGTVVQIAEAKFDARLLKPGQTVDDDDWKPEGWWPEPPPRSRDGAVLRRVVLRVADTAPAVEFFAGLLDGTAHADGDAVEVSWPGGGVLRLEPGSGPAGIDRLECDWVADRTREERRIGGARFVLR